MEQLLSILRDHFETQLKRIQRVIYWVDGFESWIQTEVMVAGHNAGYHITTKGKMEHDSDLVIYSPSGRIGIEIKHWRWGMADTLNPAFIQHPNADYYLFLHEYPGWGYYDEAIKKVSKHKKLLVWKWPHVSDWYISLLTMNDSFIKIEL